MFEPIVTPERTCYWASRFWRYEGALLIHCAWPFRVTMQDEGFLKQLHISRT